MYLEKQKFGALLPVDIHVISGHQSQILIFEGVIGWGSQYFIHAQLNRMEKIYFV